jgi:nucleoside-diphosphate-sugar epimerase
VDERVLIPRPETEEMVMLAVAAAEEGCNVLDLCTGSGAIAIATYKELEKSNRKIKMTAVDISSDALELAKENAATMVYLSSMEEYGVPYTAGETMTEDKVGIIDHLTPRSCYPESKRLCEILCASWQKEYNVPVRVLRLTQTFGPGVRYDDGRVFAEFARCAMEGRDIVLKTAGATCRSYLYTADAAAAILTVMLRGCDGQAYNAANESTYCSILQMAQMVAAECAGGKIGVRIEAGEDPSKLGYAPTLHMNLDTTRLRSLGWEPSCGLAEAFRRMMSAML